MSYQAGIGEGFRRLGVEPRDPRIVCDGCGITHAVTNRSGLPCAWFLRRNPVPGWRGELDEPMRRDYCPRCKAARSALREGQGGKVPKSDFPPIGTPSRGTR